MRELCRGRQAAVACWASASSAENYSGANGSAWQYQRWPSLHSSTKSAMALFAGERKADGCSWRLKSGRHSRLCYKAWGQPVWRSLWLGEICCLGRQLAASRRESGPETVAVKRRSGRNVLCWLPYDCISVIPLAYVWKASESEERKTRYGEYNTFCAWIWKWGQWAESVAEKLSKLAVKEAFGWRKDDWKRISDYEKAIIYHSYERKLAHCAVTVVYQWRKISVNTWHLQKTTMKTKATNYDEENEETVIMNDIQLMVMKSITWNGRKKAGRRKTARLFSCLKHVANVRK